MFRFLLIVASLCFSGIISAQSPNNSVTPITNAQYRQIRAHSNGALGYSQQGLINGKLGSDDASLSANGNLLSIDGEEVEFRASGNSEISSVCGTPKVVG